MSGVLPVDCFAQKLDSLLQNEATLFQGARDQVEEIKRELAAMRSFLEDSDAAFDKTHSKSKQTQVAHVRDLVYDVEDIIDEFIYHRRRYAGYLRTALCFPLLFWERRRIATKLREINSLIRAVPERNQWYHQVIPLEEDHHHQKENAAVVNAESALFLREEDLVGIEPSRKLMVEWLIGDDGRPSRRKTISVVGMGGSGKTTLVANVFKSPAVKRCFDCVAWVTVSQSFVIEDLLRSLIRELGIQTLGDQFSHIGYRELVGKLVGHLEQNSYLLVLDDVWDVNVWSQIKLWLPETKNSRSRIIVTTRIQDIAMYCSSEDGSHVYNIKLLDKNKAMELFCSRAFSSKKNCPPQLQNLAVDIVDKCQGLPLAIVSLGGLLSTKQCSIADWTMVYNNLQWELSNNQMLQPIKNILLLSYYDLPYRLRCCFLYCCLFPEDYKIWCGRLTRLWMAEGFVEAADHDGSITPEEISTGYLMELIRRNMLQGIDSELWVNDSLCKMHDMYREVGLTIAKQENFFHRRLSVHQASKVKLREMIESMEDRSGIRSLFLFHNDGCSSTDPFSLRGLNCSHFRVLKVLDLEDVPIEELPRHMDSMFNLRFLNLFGTPLKILPNSIGKLQNLLTLDIMHTKIETLPKGIMELQKLRHLALGGVRRPISKEYNVIDGVKLTPGSNIGNLTNLQSLRLVKSSGDLIKQLGSMRQLVVLGIINVTGRAQMDDLCRSLKNMPLLQKLSIAANDEDEILRLDALGGDQSQYPPLRKLQYLSLYGKLEKFPSWVSSLPCLVDMQMHWSRLPVEEDPLQHLQRLPSLSNVVLSNAYQGSELRFPRGFDNLRTMALRNFESAEGMVIEEGAMPIIEMLQIADCLNLKTAPEGIQRLSVLEELRLENVAADLVKRIRGPDRCYVQHIPLVRCHYYAADGDYIRENLF